MDIRPVEASRGFNDYAFRYPACFDLSSAPLTRLLLLQSSFDILFFLPPEYKTLGCQYITL